MTTKYKLMGANASNHYKVNSLNGALDQAHHRNQKLIQENISNNQMSGRKDFPFFCKHFLHFKVWDRDIWQNKASLET